jgi:hypothetical protein
MNILDIKDIRLSTAIEALQKLFSGRLTGILDLGDEMDTPKTIIRSFYRLGQPRCRHARHYHLRPFCWMKLLSFFNRTEHVSHFYHDS